MDDLVKVVTQTTGLSEEQSRQAAAAVINYLKAQLPPPIAGQIDTVLAHPGASNSATDIADTSPRRFSLKA